MEHKYLFLCPFWFLHDTHCLHERQTTWSATRPLLPNTPPKPAIKKLGTLKRPLNQSLLVWLFQVSLVKNLQIIWSELWHNNLGDLEVNFDYCNIKFSVKISWILFSSNEDWMLDMYFINELHPCLLLRIFDFEMSLYNLLSWFQLTLEPSQDLNFLSSCISYPSKWGYRPELPGCLFKYLLYKYLYCTKYRVLALCVENFILHENVLVTISANKSPHSTWWRKTLPWQLSPVFSFIYFFLYLTIDMFALIKRWTYFIQVSQYSYKKGYWHSYEKKNWSHASEVDNGAILEYQK